MLCRVSDEAEDGRWHEMFLGILGIIFRENPWVRDEGNVIVCVIIHGYIDRVA